jgi:hypothetical protein
MKKTVLSVFALVLMPGCGIDFNDLPTAPVAQTPIPPRISFLCSAIYRDDDIRSLAISIRASMDAGVTESNAISTAGDSCNEQATDLLATGDVEGLDFEFDELDAANFEADCVNCLFALIDAVYDD